MAQLEEGASAVAFASGQAATTAVFQTLAPGDHVIAPLDAYFGTARLLRERTLRALGAPRSRSREHDGPGRRCAALRPATRSSSGRRLLEPDHRRSPTSKPWPRSERRRGPHRLRQHLGHAVPAAAAAPWGWTPSMHSTTSTSPAIPTSMGWHRGRPRRGTRRGEVARVPERRGAVPAPFDAWLTLRGIRTFPGACAHIARNARAVAVFLAEHPGVERVHYPGLPRDPGSRPWPRSR